jgi:hypothetical protein
MLLPLLTTRSNSKEEQKKKFKIQTKIKKREGYSHVTPSPPTNRRQRHSAAGLLMRIGLVPYSIKQARFVFVFRGSNDLRVVSYLVVGSGQVKGRK